MASTTKIITLFVTLTAMASASWVPLFALMAGSALTHACPIPSNSTGVDAIVSGMTTLALDYVAFQNGVRHFNGTQDQYDNGLYGEITVEKAIKYVTEVTIASDALNANESQQVLNAMKLPYPTFMQELLHDIATMAPPIARLNKTADVIAIIQGLNKITDQLTGAVQKKVVPDVAKKVANGQMWVDKLFTDTIRAYQM
ncbi:hypothetical protein BO94DRAFT_628990 [Aspergillus sclerotioniger CBS 115572]|uniref:Antigenic cell wall galactomanno protein n=1 Tax=Aspergillus sclerotioniger CBS 115572 TaxID=1450535 RepID=A0A317V150_9EURO|nr:hypothetical protein BO94DRAFT_628990 [Aspergillus sclerotioniger CBS 115572]PWY66808.1 hypothetical protein BO94DRAFT_628990 [Aspergillus sclerotioniger CBS 115572]